MAGEGGRARRRPEKATPPGEPGEDSLYPTPAEPIPSWRAKAEGTRWARLSNGEWHEIQRQRRSALASGATLVSIRFILDQLMTTGQDIVMFSGLLARMIWLRKQRRRRGEARRPGAPSLKGGALFRERSGCGTAQSRADATGRSPAAASRGPDRLPVR